MGKFTFTQTEIPGVVVIEPEVFGDDRGQPVGSCQLCEKMRLRKRQPILSIITVGKRWSWNRWVVIVLPLRTCPRC